jgi:ABC-type multidrug transport system fused ATPase/permease subunit
MSSDLLTALAHRLSTIIDADRLIVLADGRMVEMDTPWNLINKPDSPTSVFKVSSWVVSVSLREEMLN